MSLSLYRKYRPETFSDIIGQEHIETTLRNAVKQDTVSHAYLFCGPRGTGKTTTARLLAKALLCEQAPTEHPDGSCLACREIAQGTHPDVYELDAASRTGVENVREEIIGRVQFSPTRGAYKIYIIDEVHMLSTQAFNALLKTLEEPPSHVKFVLCTTDSHKVPATIQSRCQRFDFHRLSEAQITERLQYICEKEGYVAEPEALSLIAQRSAGGMRDAIGSLEQIAVFAGGKLSFAAAESMLGEVSLEQLFSVATLIAERDIAACFAWVASFTQSGTDVAQFVRDLSVHVRNLYIAAVLGDDPSVGDLLEAEGEQLGRYQSQARLFGSPDRLADVLVVLGDLSTQLRATANARLALEIALTRLARPDTDLTLESLAARIALLEDQTPQNPSTGSRAVAPTPASETVASETVASETPVKMSTQPRIDEVIQDPDPAGQEALIEDAQKDEDDVESEEMTLGSARRLLRQVEKELGKAKKFSIAAYLSGASSHPDQKTPGLIIELPAEASFAKQNLERPENRVLIDSIVSELCGKPLPVTYVLGKGNPDRTYLKPEATLKPSLPLEETPGEALVIPEPILEPSLPLEESPGEILPEPEATLEPGLPLEESPELGFEAILSASFGASVTLDQVTPDGTQDE